MSSSTAEKEPNLCPFYEKTGACSKGYLCDLIHRNYPLARCLVFHHLYPDPQLFVDHLPPGELSIPEKVQQNLLDAFYLDIYDVLRGFGQIDDILVCGNRADHLVGNVLVLFREVDAAVRAQLILSDQYYAGRPIHITASPILRLSNAVCKRAHDCPNGDKCQYIHPMDPSPHIYRECFSSLIKGYGPSFRKHHQKDPPDNPNDVLRGVTKMSVAKSDTRG